MKRLVLSLLLLCHPLFLVGKQPQSVENFLSTIALENKEQHDRIESMLVSLKNLEEEDLEIISVYIWEALSDEAQEDECTCDECGECNCVDDDCCELIIECWKDEDRS